MSVLSPLVQLLNEQHQLFASWNSTTSSLLMMALLPWLIREPVGVVDKSKSVIQLNCSRQEYSVALTGQRGQPKIIIDFIPFGYDVDKLEMRFHEIYDAVDAFVIYESHLTQSGIEKPFIFPLITNSSRFRRFMDKVIYLQSIPDELQDLANLTRQDLKASKLNWRLENSMRSEMLRKFMELKNNDLKQRLLADGNNVFATQNDADEMPTREVRSLSVLSQSND
jgi:hypothetical protein